MAREKREASCQAPDAGLRTPPRLASDSRKPEHPGCARRRFPHPPTEAEHVAGLAHRSFASLVILALTAGCDNVEWGGATLTLEPPPPATVGADTAADGVLTADTTAAPPPPLPEGAVLYAGTRNGARITLHPLFELRADTILPLTDEADAPGYNDHFAARLLAPGTEFTLYADGVRVGTLVAESATIGAGWCDPRPQVTGVPELVPSAAGATRFLALARGDAGGAAPHAAGAFPAAGPEHRQASLLLGQTAIMRQEALWPDDLAQARADLTLTRLTPEGDPVVASTFMFRDRLAVEDPGTPVAYSLFVLGTLQGDRYRLDYTWYRRIGDDAKGAPRFFQQLDWDSDGRPEILLEVLGTASRWPAVLEGDDGEWSVVYEDRCAAETTSVGG